MSTRSELILVHLRSCHHDALIASDCQVFSEPPKQVIAYLHLHKNGNDGGLITLVSNYRVL
jgi:hypothetical protein